MEGAVEWINLNAFVARLVGAELVDWETYPIWSLRDAFEEDFRTVSENDINALVAAQWMSHAGSLIYDLCVEESAVDNPKITKGGSLFDGECGFNRKRWAFWKTRATKLIGEVSVDIKDIAIYVSEKMHEMEGDV